MVVNLTEIGVEEELAPLVVTSVGENDYEVKSLVALYSSPAATQSKSDFSEAHVASPGFPNKTGR